MSRSVSICRWKRNSSSIRASDARAPKSERARAKSPLSKLISALQDERHGVGESVPFIDFLTEGSASMASDGVVAGAPIILGGLPRALDVPAVFESLERGIERALIHLESPPRDLLNAEPDSPPVHWRERERFEDEQVDTAAEGVRLRGMALHHQPLL